MRRALRKDSRYAIFNQRGDVVRYLEAEYGSNRAIATRDMDKDGAQAKLRAMLATGWTEIFDRNRNARGPA